jgi:hypothetical protein
VKYVLLFVDTEQFNNELRAMGPAERDRAAVSRSLTGPSRASQVQPRPTTYSHNGRETRQPYQPRQRPIAAALPAPQHQDQAREPRLRVYVDRREIDRLHLSAAAAIDVQPAIACFECRADRRRPVVRRCSVPALDDRRATLPLGSARPGRGLQPRQMPASPVRCAAHGLSLTQPIGSRLPIVRAHRRLVRGVVRPEALDVQMPPNANWRG